MAVPGTNSSVHEMHEKDCSPAQSVVQMHPPPSARNSSVPYSYLEATASVTNLTTISGSHKPDPIAVTRAGIETKAEKNKYLCKGSTPDPITEDSQRLPFITDDCASVETEKANTFHRVQSHADKFAKVNTIDGSSTIRFASKIQVLSVYFLFNLGLTLYNKAVMIMFPFPFLMTALHAAAGMAGTHILLARRVFTLKSLSGHDTTLLSAFSILYTANIAISNASLAMVTLPFHQTVRALTPVFTVAIYRTMFAGIYSTTTYVSLLPIIGGVMLASYGDLNATALGFFLTLLGTILAAVKTVATNRFQTAGIHLSALELLHRMSPIACAQSLVVAYIYGEFDRFEPQFLGMQGFLIILVNGTIAFGLNVASFEANKRSGALTMTIAANVKQVLTVVLAVVIWSVPIGAMNACGIVVTILGGAWYGRVELMSKATLSPEDRLEEGNTVTR